VRRGSTPRAALRKIDRGRPVAVCAAGRRVYRLDIFSGPFVDRFVAFAREAARRLSEYDPAPCISPINEISFFSWASGEGGVFHPFAQHRGDEMKRQLVTASIRRSRPCASSTRHPHLSDRPDHQRGAAQRSAEDVSNAEAYRLSQFQAGT
jgi:hypothetical protein